MSNFLLDNIHELKETYNENDLETNLFYLQLIIKKLIEQSSNMKLNKEFETARYEIEKLIEPEEEVNDESFLRGYASAIVQCLKYRSMLTEFEEIVLHLTEKEKLVLHHINQNYRITPTSLIKETEIKNRQQMTNILSKLKDKKLVSCNEIGKNHWYELTLKGYKSLEKVNDNQPFQDDSLTDTEEDVFMPEVCETEVVSARINEFETMIKNYKEKLVEEMAEKVSREDFAKACYISCSSPSNLAAYKGIHDSLSSMAAASAIDDKVIMVNYRDMIETFKESASEWQIGEVIGQRRKAYFLNPKTVGVRIKDDVSRPRIRYYTPADDAIVPAIAKKIEEDDDFKSYLIEKWLLYYKSKEEAHY